VQEKPILPYAHNEEIPNSDTNACNGDLPAQHITIRYITKENLRWEVTVTREGPYKNWGDFRK
jgi:hypothetical protein